MKLFKLQQIKFSDFPDHVDFMLIYAETKPQARRLAGQNETKHRGGQLWGVDQAKFVDPELEPDSAQVVLVG